MDLKPVLWSTECPLENTLRLECLRLKSSLSFLGYKLAEKSLRCYLVDLKGERISRWEAYPTSAR
jgi:hypothetical protein